MAQLQVDFGLDPDKFMQADVLGILNEALLAAAPIQIASTKRVLGSRVGGYATGKMVESISATKPTKSKNGAVMIHIRPRGTDSTRPNGGTRKKPVRNMAKAAYLEYGVAGRQPARPWAQAATNDAEARVNEIMSRVITEGMKRELGA